jgi:DNA-binding LacI/PurR family transcriptional regulator
MPVRRPPTIEQVALRAGVSRGTVSRVLNGEQGVSARRAELVHTAIDELGYVPNRAARALVTNRTGSVALVFAGIRDGLLGHEYFARVVRGVHSTLRPADLQLVLVIWETESDRDRVERFLVSGHVDGAVLLSLAEDDGLPAMLARAGIEVVVGGRVADAPSAVRQLDVDNVDGARRAVEHLVAQGRRVIGTVTGVPALAPGADRLRGWRDTLAAHGLDHGDGLVAIGDFTRASGENGVRELLARRPDLDAVFAAGDDMALGVLDVLAAAGRRVPDEIAVVGFDGSAEAERSTPALSTVAQPLEAFGAELARLLVAALDGEHPQVAPLPTHLIVRASSAG